MISERPAEAAGQSDPGALGGRSHPRVEPLGDRHARRALDPFHDPAAPPPNARLWRPARQERPALAGHGAEAVRDAITSQIMSLPEQLRRSLTWDQGTEMAQHAQLKIDTGLKVYFCDPQSPWQRGHQREHQRPAAPVLPERDRPLPPQRRGPRGGRRDPELTAPEDPVLDDTGRGIDRTHIFTKTNQCCEDPLSPASSRALPSPSDSSTPALTPRSGLSVTHTTTPWPRTRSGSTRPS